jgi:hypothetical protein
VTPSGGERPSQPPTCGARTREAALAPHLSDDEELHGVFAARRGGAPWVVAVTSWGLVIAPVKARGGPAQHVPHSTVQAIRVSAYLLQASVRITTPAGVVDLEMRRADARCFEALARSMR